MLANLIYLFLLTSLSTVVTEPVSLNIVGNVYQVHSDNTQLLNVYKSGDSVPKGYIKGSTKIAKYDLEDASQKDIVVIGGSFSFVPGIGTSNFEGNYDKSWKTVECEALISVMDEGGKPVYLAASPFKSGITSYTITTSSGYNFGTMDIAKGSLSLSDGFKVEGGTQISNSYTNSGAVTTVVNEPNLISGMYSSSYPAYYWRYKYDTNKKECENPLNQNYLFVVETENQNETKKCGIRVKIDLYMHCFKDRFSGDAVYKGTALDITL